MTYSIYIHKHCLTFYDHDTSHLHPPANVSLHQHMNPAALKTLITDLQSDLLSSHQVWVLCVDARVEFACLESCYEPVAAAGGLVFNEFEEILFIRRLGKWDLPKGKVEPKEGIEQAATREVEEECGLKNLAIVQKLTNTYHTYTLNGKPMLKTTHWYKMTTPKQDLIPQTSEDISQAIWASKKTIVETLLLDTYDTLKPLINAALLTV